MSSVTQLGYLGITVSDQDAWEGYATGVLGLQATREGGSLLLRMDGQHHRFALDHGPEDDVAYVGWQVDSESAAREIAASLEAAGTPVSAGSSEAAERRHVQGLLELQDPDGHRVELFWGPETAPAGFASPKGIEAGFVTGSQGLGHLVLAAADMDRAMGFYTNLLGMRVSDYVSMGRMKLGFLHCNSRHHSLAFLEMPNARKQAHHFMLELGDMDEVGRTYDQVQDQGIRLLTTLGRHSNDHMTSFYMANPSSFGVEYGWGGRQVDDSCWQVEHLESGSLWGHRPVKAPVS